MLNFLETLPYKTYVGVALCSLFASYWLVPRLAWLARGLGVLITTRRSGEHVPSLGGIAIGLPFLIGFSLLLLLENQVSEHMYVVPLQTRGLFFGSVAALSIGLLHDLFGLHRYLRLCLQILLAGIAYHYGFRVQALGPDPGLSAAYGLPLTVLWIGGLINLLEVLNRHTKSLAEALLVASLSLLAAAFLQDQYRTIVVCCFLAGTLLGLLSHAPDIRPNLGSSGTYLLGYVLSVAALQGTLMETVPGVLLLGIGLVFLLLAGFIRVPFDMIKPNWIESDRLRRLRILRHYAQAVTLELNGASNGGQSWKLLCRATEAFGFSALAHLSNEGSVISSWGVVQDHSIRVPLPASGGHVELHVEEDDLHDMKLPLFRGVLAAYDQSLEAHNLRRVEARSSDLRVLLVNRYYADMSATGQILQELSEDLAASGAAVTVLTGSLRYEDAAVVPGRNEVTTGGVHVVRIAPTHFGRSTHLNRVMDHVFFYSSTLFWLLRAPRKDFSHIVAFTDPPLIALVGALGRRLKGWKFVYGVQDLYPETAHALGILGDGSLYRVLRALNGRAVRDAHAVIAVSRSMARRIEDLSPTGIVQVIPNWTDSRKIAMPNHVTTHHPFRVIYTGNMGLAQEVDLVIQLLTHFSGRDDVEFYFIGGGVRRADLTDLATGGAGNVKVLNYMGKDRLSAFLAESDIGLVTLSPVLEGLALPTKTYTYLAAGLPLLTFGVNHSDFEELIIPEWGRHFSPEELPEAIAFLDEEIRRGPGRAPREQIRAHFVAHLDRPVRTASYLSLLRSLDVNSPGPCTETEKSPVPSAPTNTG